MNVAVRTMHLVTRSPVCLCMFVWTYAIVKVRTQLYHVFFAPTHTTSQDSTSLPAEKHRFHPAEKHRFHPAVLLDQLRKKVGRRVIFVQPIKCT